MQKSASLLTFVVLDCIVINFLVKDLLAKLRLFVNENAGVH